MSRHLPLTRSGLPFLRRSRTAVQIGVDPARAVVIERLSDVAASALMHLDGLTGRHEILRVAPELEEVLDTLHERGLLDDDPGPVATLSRGRRERLSADLAAHALASSSTTTALRLLARRARSAVVVRGTDRAAAHIALGLAAAGVGTVALQGPDRTVGLGDLTPVGPHEQDVSWRGEIAEGVRRQGAHPTSLGMRTKRPALAIVCSAADIDLPWTDPELADDLLGDGVPAPRGGRGGRCRTSRAARASRARAPACGASTSGSATRTPRGGRSPTRCASGTPSPARTAACSPRPRAPSPSPRRSSWWTRPGVTTPVTLDAQVEFRTPDVLGRRLALVRHPLCGCGWGREHRHNGRVTDLPRRAVTRGARLAALPIGYAGRTALGFGKQVGGKPAEAVASEIQQRTAEQVFKTLGELKGGAMKFGQAMSIFEVALPEELLAPYRATLTKLQDAAPPMPADDRAQRARRGARRPTGATGSPSSTTSPRPRRRSARCTRRCGTTAATSPSRSSTPARARRSWATSTRCRGWRGCSPRSSPGTRHQAAARRAQGARGRGARLPHRVAVAAHSSPRPTRATTSSSSRTCSRRRRPW